MLNLQADRRLRRASTLKETQLNTLSTDVDIKKSAMFYHNIVFEQRIPCKQYVCHVFSLQCLKNTCKHGGYVNYNVSKINFIMSPWTL